MKASALEWIDKAEADFRKSLFPWQDTNAIHNAGYGFSTEAD